MLQFITELIVTLVLCIAIVVVVISLILLLIFLNKKFDLWRFKYLFKHKEITRCKKCGYLEHDPFLNCDKCKASFYEYNELVKLPNGESYGLLDDNWNNKEIVMAKWSPFNGWEIKEDKNAVQRNRIN